MDRITLAPIKGITDLTYRRTFIDFFPLLDQAVAPFLVLSEETGFKPKTVKRHLGELATPRNTIPQVLSRNGKAMAYLSKLFRELDFTRMNWNLGCPFRTAAGKGRGSGLLPNPGEIHSILKEYYDQGGGDLEVKYRIGLNSHEELPPVMETFNRFPIKELILHPRLGSQRYSGTPDLETYLWAKSVSAHRLTYNGDICTIQDFKILKKQIPDQKTWMIGRGLLKNPGLLAEIKGQKSKSEKLHPFAEELINRYERIYPDEIGTVRIMKAHLFYLCPIWKTEDEYVRKIKRAESIKEIREIIPHLPLGS